MFKTIEECRLDLVSFTVGNPYIHIMSNGSESGRLAERDMDFMPCSAARVSFGNEDKTGQDVAKDIKLMHYLAEHKHTSCFEHQTTTFLIEVPLFIRSQIMRHRTFSYNEISRRYTDENLEFWIPDKWRKQSASNKQASTDESVGYYAGGGYGTLDELDNPNNVHRYLTKFALDQYHIMLENGVCREQARSILPQSLLTKFYMTGNLRNWAHFIELRRDEHAQHEVQVPANRIADKLRELWPESCNALGI